MPFGSCRRPWSRLGKGEGNGWGYGITPAQHWTPMGRGAAARAHHGWSRHATAAQMCCSPEVTRVFSSCPREGQRRDGGGLWGASGSKLSSLPRRG